MASVVDSGAGPGRLGPEDGLEPDRSAGLVPRSRDADNRQLRLRSVFGLEPQAPLPAVNRTSLVRYYRYLAVRLAMPFWARHAPEGDKEDRMVRVVALLDPRQWDDGERAGVLCAGEPADTDPSNSHPGPQMRIPLFELEVPHGHANYHLLEDYWYWFWNWRNQTLGHWA